VLIEDPPSAADTVSFAQVPDSQHRESTGLTDPIDQADRVGLATRQAPR
jgi:hypothetical protein